jgi:hypothetical protein
MKITKFENREDWELARIGKITGSKLKDVLTKRGGGKKIGFYQLIADRLAMPADGEAPMDRGNRLEEEAIAKFVLTTEKEVDTELVIWSRDDNDDIALSPDGMIGETEAVEVKCLNSARHIEAVLTEEVPKDYEDQVIQYFVVNEKLEKLHFVFYDPRLVIEKKLFVIRIERASVQEKVTEYIELEKQILLEVQEAVSALSDF